MLGPRYRETRTKFTLPPGTERANLKGLKTATGGQRPGESTIYSALLDPKLTWKEIEWLRTLTKLPMLLKGVLNADDAERGLELGILNQIFEAETSERFAEMVHDYARQFTTPNKAAHAVGRIKRAVQTGSEISFEPALALERELQQQLFQSEDAKEGLDAYVSKRKPEFKGR